MDDERIARKIVETAERTAAYKRDHKERPMPEEIVEEEKTKEPFEDVEERGLREALVEAMPMLNNVAINLRIQKVIGTLAEYAYNQYLELHKKKAKA